MVDKTIRCPTGRRVRKRNDLPSVPLEAPAFCRAMGYSRTTCLECVREICIYDERPEKEYRKHKPTKTMLRRAGLLPR